MAQNIFIFICSKESISAKKIYLQNPGGGGLLQNVVCRKLPNIYAWSDYNFLKKT